MRKIFLGLLVTLALAAAAGAAEQRAFALKDPVTLYAKADMGADSWEVSLPQVGAVVPSAIRDKNDELWYKVTVEGRAGWLFQEGIRLKMGPKSKFASGIYGRCAKVRARAVKRPGQMWNQGGPIAAGAGEVVAYSTDGGLFQIFKKGNRTEDIYFRGSKGSVCEDFLGFNPIGMNEANLRRKVGTPTFRETPDGEREVNIFSYELSDRDMTLAFYLRDGKVQRFELYRGGTGEAAKGWPPDVIYERDQM